MSTLTITFLGICTHFTNFVEGVLHRVVLPDATGVHFGKMRLEGAERLGQWISYYLVPHFPFFHPDPLDSGKGVSLTGARVTIQNAIPGQPLNYHPTYFDLIHPLTDFIPGYEPSYEVVQGNRAASLVDIFGGRIRAVNPAPGVNAAGVIIEIDTDGPPVLSLTSIRPGVFEPVELPFHESDASITIANLELDRGSDAPPFDYLLHYLSDRNGIPPFLKRPTPGMGEQPRSMSREQMADALRSLGTFIAGAADPTELRVIDDITESCADSRYP